ncbi:MAG: asparagine synthase (glutamine-hydrolyzing) [bacterium]
MCGITGIFHTDLTTRADAQLVRRMTAVLHHRGPDDAGDYVRGPVGLASRRLAIIDRTGGAQPLFNEDRSLVLVFNGEIYNFRDLRRRLESSGHRFTTRSDSEVIVHAYEQFGTRCVEHLRGMFAFALWDEPRRSLFLARDRFGIKPLYYAWDGRTLHFASEMKALLCDAAIDRRIDPTALDDYFSFSFIPAPKSIFRAIRKLRPAHTLQVSAAGLVEQPYWDVAFEPQDRDDADGAADLVEHLRESMRLHLVSDVPVGVLLSGGVDSSSIASLAAEQSREPIQSFSMGFDHPAYDERPYARAVAERCATDAHVEVLPAASVEDLDSLIWHFDEPFADSSMMPTYHIAALARRYVKVCCAGDGGDEVFGGYRRFGRFLDQFAADPIAAQRDYLARRTWIDAAMKLSLYAPGLRADLGEYDCHAATRQLFDHAREWEPLARVQYVEMKTYLPGDLLTKVDRASMAHGLEVRVPLLDHPLVEYAARLPARLHLRDGVSKALLKHVMRDRLPRAVLERPKMGFSMPIVHWLRGELRGWFEQRVLTRDACIGEWIEPRVVRAWWEEHQRGERDLSRTLWALLVLESWARRFLTGAPHDRDRA